MSAETRRIRTGLSLLAILVLPLAGCGSGDSGADASGSSPSMTAAPTPPPDEAGALEALNTSPRHGEWVDVALPGSSTPVRTWAVYPERADKAPVVIVIMEIYGLSDWIRSVADQFAAEGFIALAPDLLSGMGPNGGGTESLGSRDDVVAMVRTLAPDEAMRRLDAVRAYAKTIPSATDKVGVVGFCWGGTASFAYAVHQSDLDAAVAYYGTSPVEGSPYNAINAPVLGLYGGDDQRVDATIPTARAAMDALGKTYETEVYEGAGHGFLRAQPDRDGANMRATEQAWPRTVNFFRKYLES
jgi:carboxymethylenebutenolidase